MRIFSWLLLSCLLMLFSPAWAQDDHHPEQDHAAQHEAGDHADHHKEPYKPSDVILHHILDSHDWEILEPNVVIHLPWIFYSSKDGLVFSGGGEALREKGYFAAHNHLYALKAGKTVEFDEEGHILVNGKSHVEKDELDAYVEEVSDESVTVYDFSLTKTSLQMILIMTLLLLVMIAVANAYKKRGNAAPKGLQSFMEPLIVFIRDEVAKPYLHHKAEAFTPYLLTLFFFIWFANLFGLMPFNSNIAGNISVTAALAVLTFILIQANGTKDYWNHIFNTPGVPWWLKFGIPLMPIVEIIGLFTKPFALAIRLFANITAGHFMVLGLVSLIFIMGANSVEGLLYAGENPGGGWAIAPLSVAFSLVIFCLEMIVAIIQPYIFTLLTAVFIGMAMESHDDHH